MKKYIPFLITSLIFSACSMSGERTGNSSSEVPAISLKKDSIITPGDSGLVYISLEKGNASVQIHKSARENVLLNFNNSGYTTLKGTITSRDSMANIRFNQIILPNGEMDGPFGREIEYKLIRNGQYRLSLGESLMAGDPWEGNFKVDITLSNP